MSGPRYFFQGLAIALALVIPTVALSIYAFRQLEISTQSKSEVQATLLTAYQVLSTLKDAENGQRGLLLSSNPEFLAPYTVALARLPAELAQLARASEARASRAMMLELTPLIEEKLQELARVLALHQGGQQDVALEGFSSGKGKALMDTIRARIGLFIEQENLKFAELETQLADNLRWMFIVILTAGTAWMLLLLGFVNLLYRQFDARVGAKVKAEIHSQTLDQLKAQTEAVDKLQASNAALNDSNALVETVLNSVADSVIRVRADDLAIQYTNGATDRLFGYEKHKLEGQALTVILPNLRSEVSPFLGEDHEIIGRSSDGVELMLNISVRSMVQSERQYLIYTLRDLTASKRIENALRSSELNLHNGIAVAGLGLGVIDYLRNEITLDQVTASLFDLPDGKAIARSEVHRRFHPEDAEAVRVKMAEALDPSGRGFMAVEHRVLRGDGSVRWLSARKQVVFVKSLDGEFVPSSGVLAVRDISGLNTVLLELARAKEAAESANLAKSRFLSNMSHELRTPLNAILGFAQLMASSNPPPNPKQQKSLNQILQAGWYLLELINEVLDLALIESGKLTLSTEPSDLASILSECQAMMEPQGKSRDVLLVFRAPESHYLLNADRTRLKQVLLNLLSNGIKYNRVGGTVLVSCEIRAGNILRISVADTGQGLSAENLEQLFQPFNRLGQESLIEEGTGIGLVLSKRLIELMGGTIGAESTVGIGSLFWIEIGFEMPQPKLLQGPQQAQPGHPGEFKE
jgi:PAS domain S-box-containing protein